MVSCFEELTVKQTTEEDPSAFLVVVSSQFTSAKYKTPFKQLHLQDRASEKTTHKWSWWSQSNFQQMHILHERQTTFPLIIIFLAVPDSRHQISLDIDLSYQPQNWSFQVTVKAYCLGRLGKTYMAYCMLPLPGLSCG